MANRIRRLGGRDWESAKPVSPDDIGAWLEERRQKVAVGDLYKGLQGNAGWQEQVQEFLEKKTKIAQQLVHAILEPDPNEHVQRLRITKMATEVNLIDTFIGRPATYVRDGEEARAELENFQKAGGERRDTGG